MQIAVRIKSELLADGAFAGQGGAGLAGNDFDVSADRVGLGIAFGCSHLDFLLEEVYLIAFVYQIGWLSLRRRNLFVFSLADRGY